MTTCPACGLDTSNKLIIGCPANRVITFPDGEQFASVPSKAGGRGGRCPDSHVRPGYFPHPGCELERCPRCDEPAETCERRHGAGTLPSAEVETLAAVLAQCVEVLARWEYRANHALAHADHPDFRRRCADSVLDDARVVLAALQAGGGQLAFLAFAASTLTEAENDQIQVAVADAVGTGDYLPSGRIQGGET